MDDGVVGAALELIEIAEAAALLARAGPESPWSDEELAYARARRDPERRLAARLAAKRAALRLLGEGLLPRDAVVRRGRGGPPLLLLSERALARMRTLGADQVLVSLSHGRTHAAASVLLLRGR
jgi:holo-[acyl-carrier protein] synthase